MRRTALEVRAWSAASPPAVFRLVRDRASWPTFSQLESFELERPGHGSEPGGVGEIGVFRQGRWRVREQIVGIDPGRRLSYILLEGAPLREYRADIDLEPAGSGTVLRWRASFIPVWPGTGWLFRWLIERGERRTLDGLAARAAEDARIDDPGQKLWAEVTATAATGG